MITNRPRSDRGKCHTVRGNLLPRIGRIHEGGVLNLIVYVLVFVEGERTTQTDVNDDADAPHVQRTVVTFISQYLGRWTKKA